MKFAQTLDRLMTEREVSAYKISKETGISDRLIGYWRNGEKLPGAENLVTIANYFGISIDYLLGRTENPNMAIDTYVNGNNTGIQAIKSSVTIGATSRQEQEDDLTKEFMEAFQTLCLSDKVEIMALVLSKMKK